MPDGTPDRTPEYAAAPRARMMRPRTLVVNGLIIGPLLLLAWALLKGPSSADIRLDTGDLRFRYLGIPMVYERMPEPQRSALLGVASKSSILKPRWANCATFPLPTSNNTHRMCSGCTTARRHGFARTRNSLS